MVQLQLQELLCANLATICMFGAKSKTYYIWYIRYFTFCTENLTKSKTHKRILYSTVKYKHINWEDKHKQKYNFHCIPTAPLQLSVVLLICWHPEQCSYSLAFFCPHHYEGFRAAMRNTGKTHWAVSSLDWSYGCFDSTMKTLSALEWNRPLSSFHFQTALSHLIRPLCPGEENSQARLSAEDTAIDKLTSMWCLKLS